MPLADTPARRTKIIDQILKAVRGGKTFLLSGHEKPDGDTIGSQLAFAGFLRRLKKKVEIVNAHPVPDYLRFLPGADKILTSSKVAGDFDVLVVFECSGAERMGNIVDFKTQAKTIINIDHHRHHNFFGHINLIHPKASSNSEQLYYVFERAKMKITREEAAALYVGLVTDTGRFQQENTTPDSYRIAGELLKTGIDIAEINRLIFGTKSLPALRLLSRALAHMTVEVNGKVSLFVLHQRDFTEVGAREEDVEDLINYGLMVPGNEVAISLRETRPNGPTKISLRGKGKVDLCALAVSLGGGGHHNASGATVDKSPTETAAILLERLRPLLS